VALSGNGRADVRSGAQSVERALAVLRRFERADRSLGVSELAAATGLTVSTTHRLTRALCAGGLLMQDPHSERYQLGPMVAVLGRRAEEHLGYARALPTLKSLAESNGESVNLGIRSGAEVLVVLAVPSPQPLRFDQLAGSRVPIHTSAMGKCLLAGPTRARRRRRAERPTPAHAVHRPHDHPPRPARRRAPTDQGAGLGAQRRGAQSGCTSGRDPVGSAAAAVAVQGPAMRLTDDRLPSVARQIVEASEDLGPLLAT
jgi:IclR family transcriptional regulator, acetate operon repressor